VSLQVWSVTSFATGAFFIMSATSGTPSALASQMPSPLAEPLGQGAPGSRCNQLVPPRSTLHSSCLLSTLGGAPRCGVPSGGACQEDGQLGEVGGAVRSRCGSKLAMIEEEDETCEETCPPSGEQGGAPCLQEGPSEGEARNAHGGPALCAPPLAHAAAPPPAAREVVPPNLA
jgi:hypothetical protein